MTRRLAHRGPDDTGTWRTDAGGQVVALGHTRLSIIDLSALGHQPMLSEDGQRALVYNGEIYNHSDLRRELEKAGHVFRSDSDTEVLLNAYIEWGDDAFARLNGMFAVALWDGAPGRERLVLARDRVGIKPLFYRLADGVLTFGSELGALRAHSAFRPEIDPNALDTYLRLGWTTGEASIYKHTRRLLPGHLAIWKDGKLEQRAFWNLVDHGPSDTPIGDYEDVVDRLEALLGDAVERRMIADVPLGAFLSGGVDSSLVVALMQERAANRVRTFSIGFDQPQFDEAPHARAVAEHLGTDHTELYVSAQQARDVVEELPALYDEPHADASAVPTVLLSRMTRDSVTVALSGDGGDELFGGYDRYEKFSRLLPLLHTPRFARRLLGSLSPLVGGAIENGLTKLARADDAAHLAELFIDRFPDRSLAVGARRPSSDAFRSIFESAPVDSDLRRAMYAEARTYMTDDVLVKVDRASMSIGLEARVPVLDHRVVEFAFGLPMSAVWHGGETKAPLRSALYRRVPRELIERPKQGFGLPVRDLLGPELDDWRDRYLHPARLSEEGLLDPEATTGVVERARVDPAGLEQEIWRLVCFQRWHARTHLGER